MIGLVHLALFFMKNKESKFQQTILKLYKFFTLTIYIRMAIEVYLFILLMVISEINYYIESQSDDNYDDQAVVEDRQIKSNYASVFFSSLILVLPI